MIMIINLYRDGDGWPSALRRRYGPPFSKKKRKQEEACSQEVYQTSRCQVSVIRYQVSVIRSNRILDSLGSRLVGRWTFEQSLTCLRLLDLLFTNFDEQIFRFVGGYHLLALAFPGVRFGEDTRAVSSGGMHVCVRG